MTSEPHQVEPVPGLWIVRVGPNTRFFVKGLPALEDYREDHWRYRFSVNTQNGRYVIDDGLNPTAFKNEIFRQKTLAEYRAKELWDLWLSTDPTIRHFRSKTPTHTIRATDFTTTPGGRYQKSSEGSGEEFRKTLLIPALLEHELLIVDLTEFEYVTSGFLEEIFGGVVRVLGPEVAERITIQADNMPDRLDKARRYLHRTTDDLDT